MKTIQHRNSGFSLVEVIIAIALLGIILVAVGGLMTGNLRLRNTSVTAGTSSQLATSYLESIKRTWSALENYEAPIGQAFGLLPDTPDDPRASGFTFELDITCLQFDGSAVTCSDNRNPELRQVRLLVTDPRDHTTAELVTQVGRPFDPRAER